MSAGMHARGAMRRAPSWREHPSLLRTRLARTIAAVCLVGVGPLVAVGCRRSDGAGVPEETGAAASSTGAGTPAASSVLAPPAARPWAASSADRSEPLVTSGPLSFAPIVRAADPGVVTVQTIGEAEGTGGRRRRRSLRGLGTGFVIDTSGLVLTNNHVIEGAESIEVRVTEDREVPASVVARDPPTDIAVLRIKAEGLVALPFGDSDELAVGDWVVAIGNPFELSHTVSVGIVSAKGRTRDDVPLDPSGYYDFLQTDASINPGNSGGPLLDLRGQVVGMNTAIRGGGAQGIGFAIPINMVRKLLPQLVRDGRITRSALGVKMRDLRELPPEERAQLKLIAAGGGPPKGAIVEHVNPGSGAEKGGIRVGDVIVGFDGTTIERGTHLQWLASMAGVGRSVAVSLVRGGAPLEVRVTLGQLALPPHVAPKGPAE